MSDQIVDFSDSELCTCGSGREYGSCCGPILQGAQAAATAEALMRSRYSAYVTGRIEYLATSLHPDYRADLDLAATRRWSEQAQWLKLEVASVVGGGEKAQEGVVEFIATYKEKGVIKPHWERAQFRRRGKVWYYTEGAMVTPGTSSHGGAKVGRNDPCPCGSGKKYKKCCGV